MSDTSSSAANFEPDYRNIESAARNIRPKRLPFYEHIIDPVVMEKILGTTFADLKTGDSADKKEYFKKFCNFFLEMGYDTVSYEDLISAVMPESGALYAHAAPAVKNREDFNRYPWAEIPDRFFDAYRQNYNTLRETMPPGMRAIGGPGNGIFECVQDIISFEELCYIRMDDPDLYADIFDAVGNIFRAIWKRFIEEYSDLYAVFRFGDDLGFKNGLLLPPEDVRNYILPQYRKVIKLVHEAGKPFLLHSCGNIFDVMNDLIDVAGIDAKHSNEDIIAPFSVWIERYGERIGNFGGVDTDILCQKSRQEIAEYVTEVVNYSRPAGGFALGSGNSIPDYVSPEGYLAMIETGRVIRGE